MWRSVNNTTSVIKLMLPSANKYSRTSRKGTSLPSRTSADPHDPYLWPLRQNIGHRPREQWTARQRITEGRPQELHAPREVHWRRRGMEGLVTRLQGARGVSTPEYWPQTSRTMTRNWGSLSIPTSCSRASAQGSTSAYINQPQRSIPSRKDRSYTLHTATLRRQDSSKKTAGTGAPSRSQERPEINSIHISSRRRQTCANES